MSDVRTCIVAEDEILLRHALVAELKRAWPALRIVAECEDGASAVEALAEHQPDVAFLDIRMPGLTGLEVAALASDASPRTRIVFVTAYDQYAIDAFERGAIDYLLKPVKPERLDATVARLQAQEASNNDAASLAALLDKLGALPNAKGYPTPEDDRFWAAALDLDMPVTVHVQLYRTGVRANQPTMRYPKEDPEVMARLRRPFLEWLVNFGLPPSVGMAQLVLSGVFERFPKLKVFFAETRLGWVPFWLEHMDLWYKRHLGWAEEMLGFKPLKELPATYVRENIYFTVQYERVAVEMRHHVGIDHIMFATDFPHIENEWPNSRPIIDEIYENVPAIERDKIWAQNAVKFFKLDA